MYTEPELMLLMFRTDDEPVRARDFWDLFTLKNAGARLIEPVGSETLKVVFSDLAPEAGVAGIDRCIENQFLSASDWLEEQPAQQFRAGEAKGFEFQLYWTCRLAGLQFEVLIPPRLMLLAGERGLLLRVITNDF